MVERSTLMLMLSVERGTYGVLCCMERNLLISNPYVSMFKPGEWSYMVGECPTLINPAQSLRM